MDTHPQSGNNKVIEIGEQWTMDVVGNRITSVLLIPRPIDSQFTKVIIEDENVIIKLNEGRCPVLFQVKDMDINLCI